MTYWVRLARYVRPVGVAGLLPPHHHYHYPAGLGVTFYPYQCTGVGGPMTVDGRSLVMTVWWNIAYGFPPAWDVRDAFLVRLVAGRPHLHLPRVPFSAFYQATTIRCNDYTTKFPTNEVHLTHYAGGLRRV